MSGGGDGARGGPSRRELILWLRERIAELEGELSYLRGLLALIEGSTDGDPHRLRPGERVEEVRAGRRLIARLYKNEDYARLAPVAELALLPEARAYLEAIVAEIRAEQARGGRDATARLEVREGPDGWLREAVISGLQNTMEVIKAKTALKHAAEQSWQYTRALARAQRGGGEG